MSEITGGCLCGAVRYRTAQKPVVARLCWCRVCQYIAGGTATANLAFPVAGFEVTGPVTEFRRVADSGSKMLAKFCPVCGTQMFTQNENSPLLLMVRAGTLDDPELARPVAQIWTRSAPGWACIDETLPKFEGPPPLG